MTETPSRQTGYDAVYSVIRNANSNAWTNALIWRAVEAFADAQEPVVAARALEQVRRELDSPDPNGQITVPRNPRRTRVRRHPRTRLMHPRRTH